MVLDHRSASCNTFRSLCLCSVPWSGRQWASGVHICTTGSNSPRSFANLACKSIWGRMPPASWFPSLHFWHLLHPAGQPKLATRTPVASAPRQSLAGVESKQLAQPALPRIPERHSSAGDGAQLPGGYVCSVCFTCRCCNAVFCEAGGTFFLPPFVVSRERPNENTVA